METHYDRINVNAGDHADAFDDPVSVATVLPPHQFNGEGVILVQDRVIKNNITVRSADHLTFDVIPHQPRRDPFAS